MFNALKYTQELERAGFTRDQAETSMKLLIDVMNENFATRTDLKELEINLGSRIHALELKTESGLGEINSRFSEINARFSEINSGFKEVDSKLRELEYKLTIKLGTMMTLAIGVTATVVKLLPNIGH